MRWKKIGLVTSNRIFLTGGLMSLKIESVTLGSGCFWCTEAIFQKVKGVQQVISGYSGGSVDNPTYQQICTGVTGHAEVIQITFEPDFILFVELLEIFWRTHDPTTLNRQEADVGTQYRSVIFTHSKEQKEIAEKSKTEIDLSNLWSDPIVTEITPITKFYPAEAYHQNYYRLNPDQPYCQFIIDPKVRKFQMSFQEKLNESDRVSNF